MLKNYFIIASISFIIGCILSIGGLYLYFGRSTNYEGLYKQAKNDITRLTEQLNQFRETNKQLKSDIEELERISKELGKSNNNSIRAIDDSIKYNESINSILEKRSIKK